MSKETTILLAEDDQDYANALSYQLTHEGYHMLVAHDGDTALQLALSENPDMLLLDIRMPGLNGWDICRKIRMTSTVPILILTARTDEIDRVLGLELGADDYILKPCTFRELLARIRANLRRVEYEQENRLSNHKNRVVLGDVIIDTERHIVIRDGNEESLTQREYVLLSILIAAEGKAVTREELMTQIRGEEWQGDVRTLDVYIKRLRNKIEPDIEKPTLLLTVHGYGYRLVTVDELDS